ncbi:hypothetical protein D9758_016034 [Tetrapyrgos nigripes]|uniref:Uncharacterized protein n=1 Tax=Tetrapyrgos nigripes TaxID=182062 RepID=A0A8H5FIK9_9AGAR|nr:hypothetical protein D9758_016034 [Tetrapyrgos nigripes]
MARQRSGFRGVMELTVEELGVGRSGSFLTNNQLRLSYQEAGGHETANNCNRSQPPIEVLYHRPTRNLSESPNLLTVAILAIWPSVFTAYGGMLVSRIMVANCWPVGKTGPCLWREGKQEGVVRPSATALGEMIAVMRTMDVVILIYVLLSLEKLTSSGVPAGFRLPGPFSVLTVEVIEVQPQVLPNVRMVEGSDTLENLGAGAGAWSWLAGAFSLPGMSVLYQLF